jgi:hypothetical protein
MKQLRIVTSYGGDRKRSLNGAVHKAQTFASCVQPVPNLVGKSAGVARRPRELISHPKSLPLRFAPFFASPYEMVVVPCRPPPGATPSSGSTTALLLSPTDWRGDEEGGGGSPSSVRSDPGARRRRLEYRREADGVPHTWLQRYDELVLGRSRR